MTERSFHPNKKRILFPSLIVIPMSISCTSGPNADQWIYQREQLTPTSKQAVFHRHNDLCQRNYQTAKALVKSRELQSSPQEAYDYCMKTQGWQRKKDD